MQRRTYIKSAGILAAAQIAGMNSLSALQSLEGSLSPSPRMPVLFVGHGSPMNAIENNPYTQSWRELGKKLPKPQAILVISAHWLTRGSLLTAMERPKTIHDFGGFPQTLFDQQYPAPGAPGMAAYTKEIVTHTDLKLDHDWGLDHGSWSVLLPMFPAADIPVYQLSIDYYKQLSWHYELGKQLAKLREKGVLIIGSGNIVHNLGRINWSGDGKVFDWALEFDAKFKKWIDGQAHRSVINYQQLLGKTADMAHPTNDHLLPLYYILALQQKNENLTYFNDKIDMGSISMRSLIIGA
jgi:4,5-DOPA dioxygenase extradiol